jgi:hypothetical protein
MGLACVQSKPQGMITEEDVVIGEGLMAEKGGGEPLSFISAKNHQAAEQSPGAMIAAEGRGFEFSLLAPKPRR